MVTTRRKKTQNNAVSNGTSDTSQDESGDVKMDHKPSKKKQSASVDRKNSGDNRTFFTKWVSALKYVVLMLLIPPFLNYAALNQEEQKLIPEGALYDIGYGQKLFMSCIGEGLPTVILDAPTGMSSDVWALIQPELAKVTKVCSYDRAGLGFSQRPTRNQNNQTQTENNDEENVKFRGNKWQEFTVERMADDLYKLVTYSSQQNRPLILVGSEIGALVSRFYAQIYESDVSDVVLIDPLVEDLFSYDDAVWAPYWSRHLVPSYQSMQISAAVGLARLSLILGLIEPPMVGDEINRLDGFHGRQKHLLCHPRHLSSVVDEHHFINDTFSQIQTLFMMKRFPSNISVTVINGNYYDEQFPSCLNKAWAKSQQNLVSKIHPGSNHILVNGADRHMLYRKPSAIIDPVKRLVKQWRNKNKSTQKS